MTDLETLIDIPKKAADRVHKHARDCNYCLQPSEPVTDKYGAIQWKPRIETRCCSAAEMLIENELRDLE